jgi:hypothetical protein
LENLLQSTVFCKTIHENRGAAARVVGIDPSKLFRKIKPLELAQSAPLTAGQERQSRKAQAWHDSSGRGFPDDNCEAARHHGQ